MQENSDILLSQYQLIIKLINKYDGLQCYNTPVKLYANVFNPERKRIREELENLGVADYKCEHNNTFMLHQICNCEQINKIA